MSPLSLPFLPSFPKILSGDGYEPISTCSVNGLYDTIYKISAYSLIPTGT